MGEVVIGVDAHKRSHTLVAVDEVGRKLGERTVAATGEGHLQAMEWASRWPGVRFALEDCRHVTRAALNVTSCRLGAPWCGCRSSQASPTRSTRWQLRTRRCANLACRLRAWTARLARSSCCQTTGATW